MYKEEPYARVYKERVVHAVAYDLEKKSSVTSVIMVASYIAAAPPHLLSIMKSCC